MNLNRQISFSFFLFVLQMERERLSRAYTSSAAAVKFYGALSPENSDNESVNEYMEHHSEVDSISQKKPFSSGGGDRKNSKLSRSRSQSEDAQSPHHQSVLDKKHGSRLNASSIERELAKALEASDEEAQAQELRLANGTIAAAAAVDTESALSLASYEDEYFSLRPKIVQVSSTIRDAMLICVEEFSYFPSVSPFSDIVFVFVCTVSQYFIWMDHLNRHTYRALLQQAQQTIEHSLVKVTEQKLTVTDKTMEELNQIFNRFGLTPTDMNIPWRGSTPKHGQGGGVQFEGDEEDHYDEEEMRTAELMSLKVRPRTPAIPTLEMSSNNKTTTEATTTSTLAAAAVASLKPAVNVKLKALKPEDAPKGRVNIPGKLIVYHPSSWRHEMMAKKDNGTSKEVIPIL